MSKFSVGERCLFVGPIYNKYLNGISLPMEVIVQAFSQDGLSYSHNSEPVSYQVGPGFPTKSGFAYVRESELRKLPGDDQSDCIPAITRKLFTTKQRNPDDVPVKERA